MTHTPAALKKPSRKPVLLGQQAVAVALFSIPLWVLAYAIESVAVSCLAATVGTILSLIGLSRLLKYPSEFVHQLSTSAIALIAIINFGFVLSGIMSFSLDRSFITSFDYLGITFANYSIAATYVMLFSLCLSLLALFPLIRQMENDLKKKLLSLTLISNKLLLYIVLIGVAVDVLAIASGIIGFRSVGTEGYEEGKIAWYFPFLKAFFSFQIPMHALVAVRVAAAKKNGARLMLFALFLIGLGASLYIHFTSGRTSFILCMVIHFFFWSMFLPRPPSLKAILITVTVASIIVPNVLAMNNFMREQKNTVTSKFADQGGFDAVVGMTKVYREDADAQQSAKIRSRDNMSRRPLVASPLAKCISMTSNVKVHMLGKNLLNSFLWVVPRAIYPDKVNIVSAEKLLYEYFPDPIFLNDTADSVYLYSYTDFGWFGILGYPLLLTLFWLISLFMVRLLQTAPSAWFIFASFPSMFLVGIGESSMIAWFVLVRNTLLFGMILFAAEFILRAVGLVKKNFKHQSNQEALAFSQ